MIKPCFRTRGNGIPVISRNEINEIMEMFIQDFQESALRRPERFEIEKFLEFYLGMTPDYQYLSHNGMYLGMTVFNDSDKIPVYNPETNRAEYIHADAKTVIIDRRLIEDKRQEHRLRFTEAHEAGHAIFHEECFWRDPKQISFPEPGEEPPMILCRTDFLSFRHPWADPRDWSENEWLEWQANTAGSALLMPRPAVRILYEDNERYPSRCSQIIRTIYDLVRICDVSVEAALYRMKDLGFVQANEVHCFLPGSPLMEAGKNL